jgi:peptidyl-prolyl cis-trans isomerase A (cyclophilin A)
MRTRHDGRRVPASGIWLLLILLAGGCSRPQEGGSVTVVMKTELGEMELAVDTMRAPITAANFLRYVDRGFYDGGRFFRTVTPDNQPEDRVKIEVIQCEIDTARAREEFPPIPMESTDRTGILHNDGTLSMARDGPNTATSSFSICVHNQPALNFGGKRNPDGYGFAAFGRVVAGMEIVRKIHASPAVGQRLTPPVRIHSVRRKVR